MSEQGVFIWGYILLVLILWSIPIVRSLLLNHKSELIALSSAYTFLLADIKSSSTDIVIFKNNWKELNSSLVFAGVLLGLLSIALSAYDKNKYRKLKEVSDELHKTNDKLDKIKREYYNLCSDVIKDIFQKFYATTNGDGRVSLYKHDNNSFMLLGRAADNPEHRKRGLETYPDDEGFIALGWQRGSFQIHDIPKWKGKGGVEYRNFMKRSCNITDDRLKGLTMKSRSYYVYSFKNHNAEDPYGIIVFEKLNETRIETDLINRIFESHGSQIVTLLKSMKSLYNRIN